MTNIKKYSGSSVALAVAVSLLLVPSITFAKENGEKENNSGKESKSRNCLNPFSDDDDCRMPPGIAKKIEDFINNRGKGNANDTIAPVISNIVITPSTNRAVITWKTDEKSNSKVLFSTVSPVNASSTNVRSASDNDKEKSHRLVLRNLVPGTTYFVVVSSKDKAGNIVKGTEMSFTTKSASTTADTVAPILSSIVATPGTTTATVTWNTNEAADSAIFFGTSLPVNTSTTTTQVVSSDLRITTHSLQMTNLSTSTTYFVVVRSRDASGNTILSAPISFTTGTTADTTAPVMTNLISVVGTSTLKFTWNTNEAATSKVFYSTTSPVNVNSTSTAFVEDLALVTAHSVTLTGLSTSTLYRIVVQSKDAALNIANGIEFPVTTSQ